MKSGEFPKQIILFDNSHALKNLVRWDESEIAAFQEARIAKRDRTPSPAI
jgi:predicted DNA-binding transcriptional regulator AlpA